MIYSYRVVDDTGFAPCVDHDMLTLACCKGGQIRNGKNILTGMRYHIGKYKKEHPQEDIYILGIYKNRLLYYALVTDILSMKEYFSAEAKAVYGTRKDQIYDTINDQLKRNNFLPHIHPEGSEQIIRDANGVYVLISDRFTYYGDKAPRIPEDIVVLLPKNRECKKYTEGMESHMVIGSYLSSLENGTFRGKIGEPFDSIWDD